MCQRIRHAARLTPPAHEGERLCAARSGPIENLVPTLEYLRDKHALSGDTKCSSLIYRWYTASTCGRAELNWRAWGDPSVLATLKYWVALVAEKSVGEHAHHLVRVDSFIHRNGEMVKKQSVEGVVEKRDVRRPTG